MPFWMTLDDTGQVMFPWGVYPCAYVMLKPPAVLYALFIRVLSSRRLRILDLGEVGIVLFGCSEHDVGSDAGWLPHTMLRWQFVLRPCIIEPLYYPFAFRFPSQAVLFEKVAKADSDKSVLVQSMIFSAWGFASNLILFALTAKPVDYANVHGHPTPTLRLVRNSGPLV